MSKKEKFLAILGGITLVVVFVTWAVDRVTLSRNSNVIGETLTSITEEQVTLGEVLPFEWDTLYTFPPYTSLEEIAFTVGFNSPHLNENMVSEGMVHLLFVRDKRVVASVLDYPDALGYSVSFDEVIHNDEQALFEVAQSDGITHLTHIE